MDKSSVILNPITPRKPHQQVLGPFRRDTLLTHFQLCHPQITWSESLFWMKKGLQQRCDKPILLGQLSWEYPTLSLLTCVTLQLIVRVETLHWRARPPAVDQVDDVNMNTFEGLFPVSTYIHINMLVLIQGLSIPSYT